MSKHINTENVNKLNIKTPIVVNIDAVAENLPFIEITFHKHVKATPLVDTGAQVSLLNEALYKKLKNAGELRATDITLSAANGTPLIVLGEAIAYFTFRGKECAGKFVIVRKLNMNCLLGMTTLADMGVIVDTTTNEVYFKHEQPECAGLLNKQLTIEPNSQHIAYVRTKCNLFREIAVVEGLANSDEYVVLPSCLNIASSRKIPVYVHNVTNHQITIARNTQLVNVIPIGDNDLEMPTAKKFSKLLFLQKKI